MSESVRKLTDGEPRRPASTAAKPMLNTVSWRWRSPRGRRPLGSALKRCCRSCNWAVVRATDYMVIFQGAASVGAHNSARARRCSG